MVAAAKDKILDYYTNQCPEIIQRARTLASNERFDEAIFSMMAVPNICNDCFTQCQAMAAQIYQQKIDAEGVAAVADAQNRWNANPSAETAAQLTGLLGSVNPRSSAYAAAQQLSNQISAKLKEDARRKWQFEMKKYEDSQAFKRSIVDACKEIGVAFVSHLPSPNITQIFR